MCVKNKDLTNGCTICISTSTEVKIQPIFVSILYPMKNIGKTKKRKQNLKNLKEENDETEIFKEREM